MRALVAFLILLPTLTQAQSRILSGQVTDLKGKPIPRANIYLDNTLDGGTADSAGHFRFSTTEQGAQTLAASAVGYENGGMPLTIDGDKGGLMIRLKASATSLENVTITAGAFEAGNDKTKTILTTLDILTTAGANADISAAIQTLPGTQKQGTETGLFVRGGDASEAAVVVDGLTAQNAYFSSAPGVATRSRFGPWQFKGVSFSSGGYSARYGQALSSVLELNTNDLPNKTNVNLGLNMAGVYASGERLMGKQTSIGGSLSYNNLSPFYGIARTNVDYYRVPQGGQASATFIHKPNDKGIIKVLASGQYFKAGLRVPNPFAAGSTIDYGLGNTTFFGSASYRQQWGAKWSSYLAGSYSNNQDAVSWDGADYNNRDFRAQGRAELKRFATSTLSILAGGEVQHLGYRPGFSTQAFSFLETIAAAYVESDWTPTRRWAFRPGLRYEHSQLGGQSTLAPRLSVAYRAGLHSQLGVSGGVFYQGADVRYYEYGYRPRAQQAVHLIANYQWMTDDRTLRLEGYYKDYSHLVREAALSYYDPNQFRQIYGTVNNSGYGYAQGLELFWRDKKTVKNLDYWLSYSYLDTRRLYRNFPAEATPEFAAAHNLSLVTKYWIQKLNTQVNATYGYASGRPYWNPQNATFLGDRTPDYHNLALTINYLTSIKKWFTVVYFGVDNLTNHKNVFGYRYNVNGERFAQRPALYRSVFVGANFSLTEFKREEI